MSQVPHLFGCSTGRSSYSPSPFREQDIDLAQNINEMVTAALFPMTSRVYYRPWYELPGAPRVAGSSLKADKDKFQISVDVQHFAPDEITVKTADGYVVVEGKHEEMRDEHGLVSRHFVRRYALPKDAAPETVESQLSADGVLTVTAPWSAPTPNERKVPITRTGPVRNVIKDHSEAANDAAKAASSYDATEAAANDAAKAAAYDAAKAVTEYASITVVIDEPKAAAIVTVKATANDAAKAAASNATKATASDAAKAAPNDGAKDATKAAASNVAEVAASDDAKAAANVAAKAVADKDGGNAAAKDGTKDSANAAVKDDANADGKDGANAAAKADAKDDTNAGDKDGANAGANAAAKDDASAAANGADANDASSHRRLARAVQAVEISRKL